MKRKLISTGHTAKNERFENDAKIVRIAKSNVHSTRFSGIDLVLIVKTIFRIVIFRKILDGDLTKITKMSRKIDLLQVIAEKP